MTDPSGPPGPSVPPGAAGGGPVCYRHPDRETWIRCQRCDKPICPDCMRDAAVGFQCPDCIREGRRTTRQAQGSYGGTRSADPRLTTFALMGVNVLVWIAILATGGQRSSVVQHLALLPTDTPELSQHGAIVMSGLTSGTWWQLLTSAFVHVEPLHIGSNMLALWFLGPPVESFLGRARFLAVYLVSALTGSVGAVVLGPSHVVTLGASGAIFGLMASLLVVMVKRRLMVNQLLMLIGLNAVFSFTFANVSWQGHLGGFIGGAVVGWLLVIAPSSRRSLFQWGAVGAVTAISLVVVAFAVANTPTLPGL